MHMLPLSPEICSNIANYLSGSRRNLLSLCLTCKAFQREAEQRIYAVLRLDTPARAIAGCTTVMNNERLALLVRKFRFDIDDRPSTPRLGRDFWELMQSALIALANIETLIICDNTYVNTWIFDTPAIVFRVREAQLKFMWDENMVRFLNSQPELQLLKFYDALDDIGVEQLAPDALPALRTFDGSLSVGAQILHTKIIWLQLIVDSETWWMESLQEFAALRRTLRSFSLLDVPEESSQRAVAIISQVLPDLRHLGIFPYPMTNRHEFYKHLMSLHYLQSLELDLSRWNPAPTSTTSQRSIAAELHTYCPSLKVIVFWMNTIRIHWEFSEQRWQSTVQAQQYPQICDTWRRV